MTSIEDILLGDAPVLLMQRMPGRERQYRKWHNNVKENLRAILPHQEAPTIQDLGSVNVRTPERKDRA